MQEEQVENSQKWEEIEVYKTFKLDQISNCSQKLIDTDLYQNKVNQIMNEMETALIDLKLQQENTQYIQVNRIFANEIVL